MRIFYGRVSPKIQKGMANIVGVMLGLLIAFVVVSAATSWKYGFTLFDQSPKMIAQAAVPAIPLPSLLLPAGGMVVYIDECICTGGFLVIIAGPLPGWFYYQPPFPSLTYAYFAVLPTVATKTGWEPPGLCRMGKFGCFTVPTLGVIIKIGVSPPGAILLKGSQLLTS